MHYSVHIGLDIPIYEEVEAYTGMRPVLVFGALSDQVVASLMESYPHMFYCCRTCTCVAVRMQGV